MDWGATCISCGCCIAETMGTATVDTLTGTAMIIVMSIIMVIIMGIIMGIIMKIMKLFSIHTITSSIIWKMEIYSYRLSRTNRN